VSLAAGLPLSAPGSVVPDSILTVAPLVQSSGTATAVWEITNANPAAIDTIEVHVYVAYAPAPGTITTANPYGLPGITTLGGTSVNNVQLSLAPEPSGGAFTAAAGGAGIQNTSSDNGKLTIPRFAIVTTPPFGATFVSIGLCQTTLLYPYVTGQGNAGFTTGLAVANTSMDPFGTTGPIANTASALRETGSCTLYAYGKKISATGVASTAGLQYTIKGCDQTASPSPGNNCFDIVAPGSVGTVSAHVVFPDFQGYVIAVCNFQYAHGYAAISDLNLANFLSSYLALELAPPGTVRGVSIEQLIH
jgi:hypothetical protein